MSAPFAKLFDTAFGQILVTTENESGDNFGPCLSIRGEGNEWASPTVTHGPWKDSPDGREFRDKIFCEFDQAQADKWAAEFTKMFGQIGGAA